MEREGVVEGTIHLHAVCSTRDALGNSERLVPR